MAEPWMSDPRCPGCGHTHPRERVGETMTFIVHTDQKGGGAKLEPKCKYKGAIPYQRQSAPNASKEQKPEVPRYYEAIGPRKDDAESKRLEGVINSIVHDVLEEAKCAPTCASFDFDPEKQLGPDKPCDCGKNNACK